jgi:hypothetical protein
MKRKTTKTKKRGAAKARPAAKRVKARTKKVAAKRSPAKTPARKTVTRKAVKPRTKASTRAKAKEVFGEGNYTASRNFDREQTEFVRKNKGRISKLGKAAEKALEGPEGKDLDAAADRARAHSHAPDEEG